MNYTAIASRVSKLIERMGKEITLRNYAAQVYDPVEMTHTPGAASDTVIHGVEEKWNIKDVDGQLVKAGDRRFMVASAVEPTLSMKLVIGGVEYGIVAVSPLQPGATTIYYTVQVRL